MGNTSVRVITFLCKTLPNAKDLQKLGTPEIDIIRKRRKISVPHFQSKTEQRGWGKKNYFHNDSFLLLPFLKKLTSFPIFLLSIHIQSNTQSSQRIFALYHGQ
jgi:hypothetical protein